jgi:SAM-dependent methyltransferase
MKRYKKMIESNFNVSSERSIQLCCLCGKSEFKILKAPWQNSMTTAGRIVEEPLSKAQCMSCGILQRVQIRYLGDTDFYEKRYSFYERPGANVYDVPRYNSMAEWIRDSVFPLVPETIFDAGCGRGWMLKALSNYFPFASISGIEPSIDESNNARQQGFNVITGKIGPHSKFTKKYDLVYATNVLEHTTDPIQFLVSLKKLVNDLGLIFILCPDSSTPSAEFMFSDQSYSFDPAQLIELGKRSGLYAQSWEARPKILNLLDKQAVVFSKTPSDIQFEKIDSRPEVLFEKFKDRQAYISSYQVCDDYLMSMINKDNRVINFGTSTWSMLLAAYCPQYWSSVDFCAIDGGAGEFLGKPVIDMSTLIIKNNDHVVLGVNPASQGIFHRKFLDSGIRCLRWDHLIER